jgi:hypothetical protein
MRTKTLLLTAALGVVGVTSSMAQAVYSVNAVGFVNLDVPGGFSIIANPLNASNNSVTNLLSGQVPDGTTVYKLVNGNYQINGAAVIGGETAWDDDTMTLSPGEGFFLRVPGTNGIKLTFVGEVPQGSLSNSLPAGFSLKSSQVPQSAILNGTNGLNFPAVDGDSIYLLRNGQYQITGFVADATAPGGGIWDNGDPIPNVGEGFFVRKIAATTWTRNFSTSP